MKTIFNGKIKIKDEVWIYEVFRNEIAVIANTLGHIVLSCPETLHQVVPWVDPEIKENVVWKAEPNRILCYLKRNRRKYLAADFHKE